MYGARCDNFFEAPVHSHNNIVDISSHSVLSQLSCQNNVRHKEVIPYIFHTTIPQLDIYESGPSGCVQFYAWMHDMFFSVLSIVVVCFLNVTSPSSSYALRNLQRTAITREAGLIKQPHPDSVHKLGIAQARIQTERLGYNGLFH